MCENSRSECSSNGCGHTFCNTCWRGHLAVQIQDGQARHISCMAYKCGVVCDEELVAQVMKVRGTQGRGQWHRAALLICAGCCWRF
jgi:ariadne-1